MTKNTTTLDPATLTRLQHRVLGLDPGAGAMKVWGAGGQGTELPSQIAADGTAAVGRVAGLRRTRKPLTVTLPAGNFYVGATAHHWGRPLENLDHERFMGSPEMMALLGGTLTRHIASYGPPPAELTAYVGLPQDALSGDAASAVKRGVRHWLTAAHTWQVADTEYRVSIASVKVTTQPVGAYFDYLLTEEGAFDEPRRAHYGAEVGIISVGMSTVELLVVQKGRPNQRFTQGTTAGVRRLLELANPGGHYSRGEMDTRLRRGQLRDALVDKLPIWQGEVLGLIEDLWGHAWRRFGIVIVVGGGVLLLRDALTRKFQGKVFVPDDPVQAISRGLYKFGVMQAVSEEKKRQRAQARA